MKSMKVAIIGAGASGLVTAKYLSQAKQYFGVPEIEIRIFEREKSIGGVYRHKVYEDAEMVSSKYLTAFSDFRVAKELPDFLPMEEYVRYLEAYCTKFGLWELIETQTEIVQVSRLTQGSHRVFYKLHVDRRPGGDDEARPEELSWDCDAVAICSGEGYPKPDDLNIRGIWRRGDVTAGFIGFVRPGIGAIPPLAELQAQLWVFNLLRHKYPQQIASPSEYADSVTHYEIDYALKARGGHDFFKTKHGVEQESYAYQLALDMGAAPTFTFMRRQGFKAFLTWAMGSNFNSKFRLVGPWKWEKGALDIMRGELFDVAKQTGGGVYTKVLQIVPNTTISLGKLGSFPTNLVIDRPYHLTYEIQDKREGESYNRLRVVPPSEIHADALADTTAEPAEEDGVNLENVIAAPDGAEFAVVDNESGDVVARSRREIIDETARQTLTTEEIEQLKQGNTDAGKDIIAKLLLSHTAIDQKTSFSLAKYKLLKTKKYIRRFTIQPLDTLTLGKWLLEEKDAGKVLEMREEMMGLLGCWANVHFGGLPPTDKPEMVTADGSGMLDKSEICGRWLVVDDTAGLVTAAMAERMGILHQSETEEDEDSEEKKEGADADVTADKLAETTTKTEQTSADAALMDTAKPDEAMPDASAVNHGEEQKQQAPRKRHPPRRDDFESIFAPTNTLTLIHPNSQPNLALLKYYNFDSTNPNPPHPLHPLATNLLPISWLQLLEPEEDVTYSTPPPDVSDEVLHSWKANRRGNYHRKRRRWARTRYIVDSTRAGGFSGLVIATTMDIVSVLRHTLPLLAGGAPIAIYSQSIEPLTELADCFSIARRAGWSSNPPAEAVGKSLQELERWEGSDDFPINPTLLLGANVQTSRAKRWQVLPGRTHPLMMGRGGAEGYVFTGWKAVPAEGKVEARGKFKRRKTEA
ncbi:tRNA (adenine-n -)-methyltransferase non-catalytic subunit [Colletotrichum sp. SAR 10_66]|nr:tRNA (adenine-n -)-methyltransferase non-catalytic subunit [Colletotrichum sp. SAR 10_66]